MTKEAETIEAVIKELRHPPCSSAEYVPSLVRSHHKLVGMLSDVAFALAVRPSPEAGLVERETMIQIVINRLPDTDAFKFGERRSIAVGIVHALLSHRRDPGAGEVVAWRDALADAYIAGATAVHQTWLACKAEGPPGGDPDFSEAANDYSSFVEPLYATPAPQPGRDPATIEADLEKAVHFGVWSQSGPTNDAEIEMVETWCSAAWEDYKRGRALAAPAAVLTEERRTPHV